VTGGSHCGVDFKLKIDPLKLKIVLRVNFRCHRHLPSDHHVNDCDFENRGDGSIHTLKGNLFV
jgi:hypothetical protein